MILARTRTAADISWSLVCMHAYTRVRDHERVPIFLCLPVYLLYSQSHIYLLLI